jgi:hypothetical protein
MEIHSPSTRCARSPDICSCESKVMVPYERDQADDYDQKASCMGGGTAQQVVGETHVIRMYSATLLPIRLDAVTLDRRVVQQSEVLMVAVAPCSEILLGQVHPKCNRAQYIQV